MQWQRTNEYRAWRFWLCVFALAWATALLYAGGFTTTIDAGMAFLDWPLSNGSLNPEGWTQDRDQLAEHSHRLMGAKLGLIAIVLWAVFALTDARPRARLVAAALFWMVLSQGLIGGLRVKLDDANPWIDGHGVSLVFRVLHAMGAQVVVVLLVALTLQSSRGWMERSSNLAAPAPRGLLQWGHVAVALVFMQILLGAIMRHKGAGLVIPYFPQAQDSGSWLPIAWSWPVVLHFAHRWFAFVVAGVLIAYASKLVAHPTTARASRAPATVLMVVLALQMALGMMTIWTGRNEHVTTLHMLFGAVTLALTWGLWLTSARLRYAHQAAAPPVPHLATAQREPLALS